MQIPQDLIETAALKLKSVKSEAEFFQLRAQYLGKKSFVVSSFSSLRDLKPEEKITAAKELNILKNDLTKLFENALEDTFLIELIDHSYDLVVKSLRKKDRETLESA